jgi:hypothetical protein
MIHFKGCRTLYDAKLRVSNKIVERITKAKESHNEDRRTIKRKLTFEELLALELKD